MESISEMPQHGPEKALVVFHDVAAYFSEEEWKLLHQWQKELYKKAMEDIHEALISLGYRIVNRGILLRIDKAKQVYTHNLQDPARRSDADDTTSSLSPDILLRIKHEGEPHWRDHRESEETDARESPSVGCYTRSHLEDLLRIKQEGELICRAWHDSEGIAVNNNAIPGHAVIAPVVAFTIKEEDRTDSMDTQDLQRRQSIKSSTSDGTMSIHRIDGERVHLTEKIRSCQASLTKSSMKVLQRSEKGTNSKSQLWPDTDQEHAAEKNTQDEYGFSNPQYSSLDQGTTPLDGSDNSNECESRQINATLLESQPSMQQNCRPYSCSECHKSFCLKGSLTRHMRRHVGEEPIQTTECNNIFSQKGDLIGHLSVPTGRRLYLCNACGKSFSRKGNLITHQTTHNGERPYECPECDKSFSHKEGFMRHKRTHTGERPYQCTECEKSFSQRGNLITHLRTHMGEKPYHCTDCGKNFRQKVGLIKHKRTHTGERPFECTDCEKSFSQKESFIRHQRTHSGEKPYHCTDCGKRFSQKGNLMAHQRTHSEKRTKWSRGEVYFHSQD